jgi:transposase
MEDINVDSATDSVKELLGKEQELSPALRSALEVLLILVTLLLNRLTLNSKNSSQPLSTDPNRQTSSQGDSKGVTGTPCSRRMIRMR